MTIDLSCLLVFRFFPSILGADMRFVARKKSFSRFGAIMLVIWAVMVWSSAVLAADPTERSLRQWFGDWLGFSNEVMLSAEELRSVGCLMSGGVVGAVSLGLGGAVMAFTGFPSNTGVVAMPVLAASVWAGCAFGSAAAPGLAWLIRNSQDFVRKIGDVAPSNMFSFMFSK
ncbi:membrane hypothetical protein [Azospirillaceae bacterium]